jgi:hypothetical protein
MKQLFLLAGAQYFFKQASSIFVGQWADENTGAYQVFSSAMEADKTN